MLPTASITRKGSGLAGLEKALARTQKTAAYVGVPASNAERDAAMAKIAAKSKAFSKRQLHAIKQSIHGEVNNAELLYIHSKGSPLRHIPARPVLEPAIMADGNRQPIARELAAAAKAELDGKADQAKRQMKRAAIAGQNAARRWFTDNRNGWAPNAPSTIAAKGSDKPMIDFGVLRQAIVGITREDA